MHPTSLPVPLPPLSGPTDWSSALVKWRPLLCGVASRLWERAQTFQGHLSSYL